MTNNLPESQVLKIWQACAGRSDLETEEDGPVQVIYPGRMNDGRGADFRDAVVQTARGRLTGDIEVHTRSSHWRAHRHHLDPVYNRVVLHVVFRHDTAHPVRLENGNSVPTLALRKSPAPEPEPRLLPSLSAPCGSSSGRLDTRALSGILDVAGERRFQARAAGFQAAASPDEAGQALYRGIMAALGYVKNRHPMAALACRVPLRRLEAVAGAPTPDVKYLAACQALLIGTAGLLPSQSARGRAAGTDERWLEELERWWAAAGEEAAMSAADWQFFRVRPVNSPARRIAAMARLLLRCRQSGLLNGLVKAFTNIPAEGGGRELEESLMINTEDARGPALLGRGRAAVIAVNVLLPFMAARGRVTSRPELAEKALAVYRRYPALPANTLEKHMARQLGMEIKEADTARRQQGLLHLFKTYCSLGGCRDCPVGPAV